MKRKLLLLVLICFLVKKNFAQDSSAISGTVTLKQCVEIAIKNNLDVNRAELLMQASKINWQLAKGNMFPFVSGNINHGASQGRVIDPFTNSYINQNLTYATYGVDASIYLWNGSSIQNNIRANRFDYEASRMDWQQSKDNITINVILAYLQVLNNEEQLSAARAQADVTRKQAERLEILNKQGAIAPATYYDMRGQLANEELNVITTKNALETARLDLCQLMNISYSPNMQPEKVDTTVAPALYENTPEALYNTALQELALVKAADLKQLGASKAVQAARGRLLPALVLGGSLGTNYSNAATTSILTKTEDVATNNYVLIDGTKLPVYAPQSDYATQKISYGSQWKNNFNSSVSIGLQIPILNGLQARSQLNQAKVTEKRINLEAKTTKIQLRQNIEQAFLNMTTAFERYQTLSTQVNDFGESFRSAEIRFNAGAITSVDYLIAKNNFDRANINLIAAKYDYILRTKILDFYKGQLNF